MDTSKTNAQYLSELIEELRHDPDWDVPDHVKDMLDFNLLWGLLYL